MQKIGDSTSTANGAKEFTKGQPGTGVDATVITAEWLNAIQRELVNLVLGGGLSLVPGDDSQVLKAIQAIQLTAVTWAKLGGKPTTIGGFGITDAFTKSETAIAIQKAVSDLVASSPAALDTLKELADALGNDPNFATTMTNALASKAAKATTLAGYGITNTYTKDEITAMIAQASALPVGAVIAFPVDKVVSGFLELDGSVKSAATYPDLATFLGGAFNRGDEGVGNFRLPESRGEFLRGWDHGRGVDAGRVLGSYQADMFKSHTHGAKVNQAAAGGGFTTIYSTGTQNNSETYIQAEGGAETRPRNLAVIWCIKAWSAPISQGNIDIAALAAEVHGFAAKLSQLFKTSTDVKASRAINVEYRNERDVPILVSIGLNSTAASQTAVLLVDGKTVLGSSYPSSGWSLALVTVVPANGTYKIPSGSYTLNTFVEFT